MSITDKQKRWLKKQTHHLKPVVMVGQQGISEAVIAELDRALSHHELLKVRVSAGDRDERDVTIALLGERTGATLVGRIGHVASFYRANPKKRDPILLPPDP
jgi:RNA-binding protein